MRSTPNRHIVHIQSTIAKSTTTFKISKEHLSLLDMLVEEGKFANRSEAASEILKIHLQRVNHSREEEFICAYIPDAVREALLNHYSGRSEGMRTALYDFSLNYKEYQAKVEESRKICMVSLLKLKF